MSERARGWNDACMIALAKIAAFLLGDVLRFVLLFCCPSRTRIAENRFLRRQLALYRERGLKLRRIDAATRISLALQSKLFHWRCALVVVRPRDLDPLAPGGLAAPMALEVPAGTSGDPAGVAPVDPAHGKAESALG